MPAPRAIKTCSMSGSAARALVIASDLDNKWSDFPLHASFVPFLHEAVRYLASAHGHASEYLVARHREHPLDTRAPDGRQRCLTEQGA